MNGAGIDERLLYIQYDANGDEELRQYYHANHQGTIIAMSNGGQLTPAKKYTYDSYGVPGEPEDGQPFRYTGRRWDSETGLYYYRARYYSAKLGGFLQTDPIGYEDNMNLYGYTGNDPVNKIDPTGLKWVKKSTTCVEGKDGKECNDSWEWEDDGLTDYLFGGFPAESSSTRIDYNGTRESVCAVVAENALFGTSITASAEGDSRLDSKRGDFFSGTYNGLSVLKLVGVAFGTNENKQRTIQLDLAFLSFYFSENDDGFELSGFGAGSGVTAVGVGYGVELAGGATVDMAGNEVTLGAKVDGRGDNDTRGTASFGLKIGQSRCTR